MTKLTVLGKNDVSRATLAEIIREVWDNQEGLMMVFLYDKPEFQRYDASLLASLMGCCYDGRLFNNQMEIHWRLKTDNVFTVTIAYEELKSDLTLEGFSQMSGCEQLAVRLQFVYLWGALLENQSNTWFEQRIPRKFSYPIDQPIDRVRAVVYEYVDQAGQPVFIRFARIE